MNKPSPIHPGDPVVLTDIDVSKNHDAQGNHSIQQSNIVIEKGHEIAAPLWEFVFKGGTKNRKNTPQVHCSLKPYQLVNDCQRHVPLLHISHNQKKT